MSRLCCVNNCISTDPEKRNTLFKFPDKGSENYQLWLKAVGDNLNKRRLFRKYLYICDLHFDENCFERDGIKIIKDGVEVTVPRKRLRLRIKSVPSIFPENSERSRRLLSPVNQPTVSPILGHPSDCSSSHSMDLLQLSTPIIGPKINFARGKAAGSTNTPILSQFLTPVSQPSDFPIFKIAGQGAGTPSATSQIGTYSKAALMNDWNSTPYEENLRDWGMFNTAVGVFFGYRGDTGNGITRSILVKDDMTVEVMCCELTYMSSLSGQLQVWKFNFQVRARGHIAKFPVLDKIASFQDIYFALLRVTYLRLCEGTNDEPRCTNGFYVPKSKSKSNRCQACQVENRRRKDREWKRAQRSLIKTKQDKKFVKYLQQKYNRCVKKIASIGQDIEVLMAHRSTTDE